MALDKKTLRQEKSAFELVDRMNNKLCGLCPEKINEYIRHNPDDSDAYVVKGIMMQKGDYTEALQFFRYAMDKFPDNNLLFFAKGTLYEHHNLSDYAIACFERSLQINPNTFESIVNLGTLYNRKGKYEKAKKYWNQIIEMDPSLDIGWFGLSKSEYNLQDYDNALEHLNKAIENVPKDCYLAHRGSSEMVLASYIMSRAEFYLNNDKIDDAMKDIEQAFKVDKETTAKSIEQASFHFLKNDRADIARLLTEKLVDLEPRIVESPFYNPTLAALHLIEGNHEKAEEICISELVKLGIDEITLMNTKARFLAATGNLEESIKVCEQIIEKTNDYGHALNIIGMAKQIGDDETANKYKKIIKKDKDLVAKLKSKFGDSRIDDVLE